ncbi:MAG TPA: ATP synthase F1 subunit delta [Longimicrobiales bacterium]|nr:ATP synthase F1 subunit delta [Longimicrobiales bacterium]
MEATTVARNYGEVLFELAERNEAHDDYRSALEDLVALFEQEPRLRTFLETPKLPADEKKRVLREVLAERVPRPFLNFLMIVIDKRRQRLLPLIAEEYRARVDRKFNRLDVEVVLAAEPDERLEEEIRSGLSERLGRTIVPRFRIHPEIIGGAIVRYGDNVIDGSLRRQLLALRRRMTLAVLPDTETV